MKTDMIATPGLIKPTWGQVLRLTPPKPPVYRAMRPIWDTMWPISRAIRRNQAGTRL